MNANIVERSPDLCEGEGTELMSNLLEGGCREAKFSSAPMNVHNCSFFSRSLAPLSEWFSSAKKAVPMGWSQVNLRSEKIRMICRTQCDHAPPGSAKSTFARSSVLRKYGIAWSRFWLNSPHTMVCIVVFFRC
jgi:hypothetical protein